MAGDRQSPKVGWAVPDMGSRPQVGSGRRPCRSKTRQKITTATGRPIVSGDWVTPPGSSRPVLSSSFPKVCTHGYHWSAPPGLLPTLLCPAAPSLASCYDPSHLLGKIMVATGCPTLACILRFHVNAWSLWAGHHKNRVASFPNICALGFCGRPESLPYIIPRSARDLPEEVRSTRRGANMHLEADSSRYTPMQH